MSDTQVRDELPRLAEDGDPIASFAGRVLDVLVDRSRRTTSTLRHELVQALADSMVIQDQTRIDATLRGFRRACISPRAMAEVYVPEAARLLGAQWAADGMCFSDVTIGTARLQALVRAIGTRWVDDVAHDGAIASRGASVVMVVPSGHDHTLGAVVASGRLRRMGVSVCLRLCPSPREMAELLRARTFDAAMVSIGHGERLDVSRRLVETLRRFGPAGLPVVAGGPAELTADELKHQTGADLATCDLEEALAHCGIAGGHHAKAVSPPMHP